ncbi:5-formyltetrahydrofolate cyclo-ligase [Spirosoma terrae]|uniref:5-formyltetrahydrofolate cyclo-ligase n=1 Tax=Spirosoma terrae TaxID=1968276 RepID=A0A6L9L969_9BACT|nr:5-formyltetrahydrofolate cyclo-ligase [Spirosoma terrae]NDU93499.1 5-formyltetrahydrofolate cyclo-ligase [Spirosoma terrae]
MTKAELRRQFLSQRKALPKEAIEAKSQQICQLFLGQEWVKPQSTIHTFLPISRQNEVNTWPIVHRLWQEFPQVQVAVSVTDTEAYQLTHYVLTPDSILVENRWKILEPLAEGALPISTRTIDIVLVPLLAFDQTGHRVGYGAGFYDRFLADCRPDCLKIGVSLFEPIVQIDDTDETDIALDVCITPDKIWFFS